MSLSKERPGGLREMFRISLPMVVSFACDTAMTFTDRLFLSKLGAVEMNAVMSGGITFFLMISFFLGLIGYVTALCAQYYGAEQRSQCPKVTTQAFLMILAVYPFLILSQPLVSQLGNWLGLSVDQLSYQAQYLNILIYGSVFSLSRHALSGFFSGIGKTRHVMAASLLALMVNVGANYCLIYGKLGFPAMGIRGAAIGTIFASLSAVVYLFVVYVGRDHEDQFAVSRSFVFDRDVMGRLIKFGYPSGIEFTLNILAFSAIVFLFHAQGPVAATAVTIVFNWDMVTFVPLLGIEIGVTSLMGRYKGAGQLEVARRAVGSGFKLGLVYAGLMLLLFVSIPEFLVGIFSPSGNDPIFVQAFPLAVSMVKLVALYVLAEVFVVVFIGALRGAGDTNAAMFISVSIHWAIVAALYLVLHHFKWGTYAAWVAVVLTFIVLSLGPYGRYRQGGWVRIHVID